MQIKDADRKTIAPRLPHVIVRVVKENADRQTFLTVSKIRDHVAELAKQDGWNPSTKDYELLYRRTLNLLKMLPDIDPKVSVREAFTPSKTKIFKIYYNA